MTVLQATISFLNGVLGILRNALEQSKLAAQPRGCAGAGSRPLSPSQRWEAIDWKRAQRGVIRLQRRIAKAWQAGQKNKARCLQRILLRSHYARLLAVKRVTSSKGSKKLFPTVEGTPQGGIISPVLCNMTLDGLEARIKSACPRGHRAHFVRYADDFIVACDRRDIIERHLLPVIKAFLEPRALQLSEEKTRITHIAEGFDFLGQNLRKYDGKLLIKPSKDAVRGLLEKVRCIARECRGHNARVLVNRLNPVLRGWANYHKHVAAKSTFAYVDHHVHRTVLGWAKRTHSKKSLRWIYQRYFLRPDPGRGASFTAKTKDKKRKIVTKALYRVASTRILRRVKIRGAANPFDPRQSSYFAMRRKTKGVRENGESWKQFKRSHAG